MSSAGPNSPGTLANDTAVGTNAWSNPGNAAASDNSRATFTSTGSSNYLKATNFGFSIPAGATIDGIVVEVERSANLSGTGGGGARIEDLIAKLVVGGTVSGTSKAVGGSANRWPLTASEAYKTFGASNDLWGLTLSVSDVNASNFGFVLQATGNLQDGSEIGSVDHIRMTVYYTPAGGAQPVLAQSRLINSPLIGGALTGG